MRKVVVVVEATVLCTIEFPEGEGFDVDMDSDAIETIVGAVISQSSEIECGREVKHDPAGKLAFDRTAFAKVYSEVTDSEIIEDGRQSKTYKVGDIAVILASGGIFEVAAIDYGETGEPILSPKNGIGDGPVAASLCRHATEREIKDCGCWFLTNR